MYETGGEITFVGKLILVILVPPIILLALQDYLRAYGKMGAYFSTAFNILFAVGVVVWLGLTIYRTVRSIVTK